MPGVGYRSDSCHSVILKAAAGGRELVGDRAIAVAPQDVVAAVAVEIAGTDDLPVVGYRNESYRSVILKAAAGRCELVDNSSIVIAPENVVAAVAVEIAGAHHMPVGRHRNEPRCSVIGKASAGRREPVGDRAIVVAP